MRYRPDLPVVSGLQAAIGQTVRVSAQGLLGIVLAFQAASGQDQPVRERVRVGVIRISVAAQTSAGKPVGGLSLADLTLKVDGRSVPIDSLTGADSEIASAAPAPGALEARPEAKTPSEAVRPRPEPSQLAVLIDEDGTSSLDRRDVYRQLERYLGDGPSAERSVMIARFNGPKVEVLSPWTQDLRSSRAALKELAARPRVQKIASPYEAPMLGRGSSDSLQKEVLVARDHLFGSILVMLAAFPPAPARRTLLLVSGGMALLSPEDFAANLGSTNFAGAEAQRGRPQFPDATREIELARTGFEVWTNAQRRDWHAQLADVMAKAQESNIALTSVAAEAFERGTNPTAETNNLGPSAKWAARPMPGVGAPGSSGLSPRLGVGQTMTTMAIQTGGEAILQPTQTAQRLSGQESVEPYVLTFRDPFPDDHRHHRVEIATIRPEVILRYRRGYRTPTDEEETLDGVMARLVGPAPPSNPLSATARITRSDSSTAPLRLHFEFQPPAEHGIEEDEERPVQLLFANVDDAGGRSEPAKWEGTARRVGTGKTFAAELDLKTPVRVYRWSIAVRDDPTGLVSYVVTDSRP
jgi:VWFA-related protein